MNETELRAAIQTLEDEAAGEPFTSSQRDRWNDLNEQLDEYKVRRERLLELAGNQRSREDGARFPSVGTRSDETSPAHVRAAHDAGLRAIERNSGVLEASAADRLDGLIRERDPVGVGGRYLDAVGDPHYLSAFGKMFQDPMQGHLRFTPQEVEAVRKVSAVEEERAMSIGTGSAGGFAVPFTLDPTIIITGTGAANPIRDISSVETIVTHEWRGVTADSVVAAFGAEAAPATDASPTLVQPDLLTQKAFCFIPVSIELTQDWGSLQQNIANLIYDAKNTLEATKFLTGTGTNEPSGILNIGALNGLTTTQRVQTAVSATFAVGDPWLLKAQVPARFIATSTWAAAPAIWDKTYRFVAQGSTTEPRQFGDGDRGGNFVGRPKVEWSPMTTTTTTGSRIMIGGDFKTGYKIVDRIGMQIETIPHLFGAAQGNLPTGQRGFYAYWRVGAGVIAPNAFRYLEVL